MCPLVLRLTNAPRVALVPAGQVQMVLLLSSDDGVPHLFPTHGEHRDDRSRGLERRGPLTLVNIRRRVQSVIFFGFGGQLDHVSRIDGPRKWVNRPFLPMNHSLSTRRYRTTTSGKRSSGLSIVRARPRENTFTKIRE